MCLLITSSKTLKMTASKYFSDSFKKLKRKTVGMFQSFIRPILCAGSATPDISCLNDIAMIPSQCPYNLRSDIKELIPPGTVVPLSGRSNLTIKDINVHVGIIDTDYEGEMSIVITVSIILRLLKNIWKRKVYSTTLASSICNARLLCLTKDWRFGTPTSPNPAASTDPLVAFTSSLHNNVCPIISLEIDGKQFRDLIDTRDDLATVSTWYLSHNGILQYISYGLQGIHNVPSSSGQQSTRRLIGLEFIFVKF